MSRPSVTLTSILWMILAAAIQLQIAAVEAAEPSGPYRLPRFRQTESGAKPPAFAEGTRLRLLADADFPPFSFTTGGGGAAGLAVELALAACEAAKVSCEVILKPYAELRSAFASHGGDAIIAGPQLDDAILSRAQVTRAWFKTLGRFAVQTGSPLTSPGAKALAGKRIGAVRNSQHAAWLAAYYGDSEVVAFDTEQAAFEALRTGGIDALFGDDLRLIYWVVGSVARGCCKLLGGAFVDPAYFTRNLSFVVQGGRPDVRQALDYGLDKAQDSGTTEQLFNRYVPLDPW